MSILKGHPTDTIQRRPYDSHGQYVPLDCSLCGAGKLQHQGVDSVNGKGFWACGGLLDPEDADRDLEPCPNIHYDGEPRLDLESMRPTPRGNAGMKGGA